MWAFLYLRLVWENLMTHLCFTDAVSRARRDSTARSPVVDAKALTWTVAGRPDTARCGLSRDVTVANSADVWSILLTKLEDTRNAKSQNNITFTAHSA
ncbi:hypothetical protein ElyMa_005096500 [Elysia marginata]|uniref:Secreted protein n=1 Tax=Elysia marginata TaxID=1093978 RepID=A0AAV4JGQ3_9GAST|nr:hypothetical protein ElyMa_005096500 [Elysia marginata]